MTRSLVMMTVSLALACTVPKPPPASPAAPESPLRRANGDFHVTYAAARAREQATLGTSRPFLVLADQKLVLRYRGKTEERSVASARFDSIKQASHAPIAALSAILAGEDARALHAQRERLMEVLPVLPSAELGDVEDAARAVVLASIALLESATREPMGDLELHAFGLRTLADTTRLLQAGCDESLARIDAATRALRPLTGDAWPSAIIAIATDHQSRALEVGVQYFEQLFHEDAKEGALGEGRIVVIESIGPNDGTPQAVASHLYDRRLSVLLFDDPTFLQGDVLGRHAKPTIAKLLAAPF